MPPGVWRITHHDQRLELRNGTDAFKHELLHFKGNDRFFVEFLEVLVAHNYSDSDEDDKKALVPVRLAARHLRMVSINRSAAESFVK